MKHGPPLSPKLREQIVSATHNVAPSMYTLHAGVIVTSLTHPSVIVPPKRLYVERALLPALLAEAEASGQECPLHTIFPTVEAMRPCVAPLPEPVATPLPGESGRPLHQYRKRALRNPRTDQDLVRAIEVSPARCWCPFHRLQRAWDEKPLLRPDSSLRRVLVLRPRHARIAFRTHLREQNAAGVGCQS